MKLSKTGVAAFAFAVLAAAALFLLSGEKMANLNIARQLDEARQQSQSLEDQLAGLRTENDSLRDQLKAEGLQPVAPAPAARPVESGKLEAVRELAAMQTRYESLQQQFTDLQNRFAELEGTLEKLTGESRRSAGTEVSLKDQLASTQRVVTAMEAELKSKSARVEQLEESVRRFRDQASGADRRSSQTAQVLRQLDDINRRREDTLNAMHRRYRDVTDQLRALALRLDTQRDSPSTVGATDISRITSAVQSAEEDLRVLTSLNTQARAASERLQQ
jgi:chromosome segregation ATPase